MYRIKRREGTLRMKMRARHLSEKGRPPPHRLDYIIEQGQAVHKSEFIDKEGKRQTK